jgi:hypothetical protein
LANAKVNRDSSPEVPTHQIGAQDHQRSTQECIDASAPVCFLGRFINAFIELSIDSKYGTTLAHLVHEAPQRQAFSPFHLLERSSQDETRYVNQSGHAGHRDRCIGIRRRRGQGATMSADGVRELMKV